MHGTVPELRAKLSECEAEVAAQNGGMGVHHGRIVFAHTSTHRSRAVFAWLMLIITLYMPLTWLDDKGLRDFSKHDPVSIKTMKLVIRRVVRRMIAKIVTEVCRCALTGFGIEMDGWGPARTFNAAYSLFLIYKTPLDSQGNPLPYPLLALAPVGDGSSHTAQRLHTWVAKILIDCGLNVANVLFLVADNTNVNGALGTLTHLELIALYCCCFSLSISISLCLARAR